jgi:predicted MPP superfamily phosphohydrolase
MNDYISFIHLSDIHFTKDSGGKLDLDEDLRNEILLDIKNNAKNIVGNAKGILVCGDIAYSGKPDEYVNANDFLKKICDILNIDESSIFCVPGNHDVDQAIPKNSELFSDMQYKIENSNSDEKIIAYFLDPMSNNIIFKHIHEYNFKFASRFGCDINDKEPIWEKDFPLNDRSTLRVIGLNSIIISNHNDNENRRMVIGEYQIPLRLDGVTYLSLCHHPPECWKDAENKIRNKINERIHVQLYGHKHIQKISKVDNSLIIGSGAAHPSRKENNWKPRYNWIKIKVDNTNNTRKLIVLVYPRVLNDNGDRFIADYNNCEGADYKEYKLFLDNWDNRQSKQMILVGMDNKSETLLTKIDDDQAPTSSSDLCRTLIYRFLTLSFIKRSAILADLNLIDEEDDGVSHADLLEKVIQKAQNNNTYDVLLRSVNDEYEASQKKFL